MKVSDLFPSRRDLLGLGGRGLAAASLDHLRPLSVYAASSGFKARPRGNARNVIFYEISGAISHLETFDFKESAGTPKDIDIRKLSTGVYFPHALFPRLEKVMDRVAIVRSFVSDEEVHFRGQYYIQTGRPMNVAFARETPALGWVIASELEPRRRETDTFPSYVSFSLETNQVGALATGFLPPRYSVFDLNPEQALKGMALDQKAVALLEERWRVLAGLRDLERERMKSFGRDISAFADFSTTAKRLLTDQRWPTAFQLTGEDRKRYGNSGPGLSCALARNLLKQDAGTHYIHVCQHGWDHHRKIWDHAAADNHYKLIADADPALASLIEDLAVAPSPATPGKTLLDETLVVFMSEFGRTPGPLNHIAGRDHHKHVFPAMFAGAGVKGGTVLGASDKDGNRCAEAGWHKMEQPRIENVVATIYSALGIDWSKELRNTPSGRAYAYVDPLGAGGVIPIDDVTGIYR
ncbi:MAG: DUF1501 domain-containing protein [Acidobacteria bacterium]|nr:DUF1501 domain-containing protein [Acidobacteriota bacterium]